MSVASAALLLFLIMDGFGNIPLFLSALKHVDPARWTRVIIRELLFALLVLLLFLFGGRTLLAVMHISQPALSVAGGILLFLLALRMVFPSPKHGEEDLGGEPFIVPLAVPLVAGPSGIATVILIGSGNPSEWPKWLAAVILAWGATASILLMSTPISRMLGTRGLVAVERLMGMLTVAIAVQLTLSGIATFVRDTMQSQAVG